jgi:hypothetical protein
MYVQPRLSLPPSLPRSTLIIYSTILIGGSRLQLECLICSRAVCAPCSRRVSSRSRRRCPTGR